MSFNIAKLCAACLTLILGSVPYLTSAVKILAYPYFQPGNASTLIQEKGCIRWITDNEEACFKVLFGKLGSPLKEVSYTIKTVKQGRITKHYRASFEDLAFDASYRYEVYLLEDTKKPIRNAEFRTRTKGSHFRFIAMGCSGEGTEGQKRVALQIERLQPNFLMHLGDFSYSKGTMSEYYKHIFPYYNSPDGRLKDGSSLMSHVPFYLTFGNHDICDGRGLSAAQDALAPFYIFDLPNNGPKLHKNVPGSKQSVETFQRNVGPGFESATNYSFDYGNVHFLVLDGNAWVHPYHQTLRKWIKRDLRSTKAKWKIACIHQPPFSSTMDYIPWWLKPFFGSAYADRERSRKYVNLFQKCGADLVLSAHTHAYERSKPIKYNKRTKKIQIDHQYNGTTHTHPNGIPYIISGAGGAHMHIYSAASRYRVSVPYLRAKYESTDYVAKSEHEKYSFMLVDVDGGTLKAKQIDDNGNIVDQFWITK